MSRSYSRHADEGEEIPLERTSVRRSQQVPVSRIYIHIFFRFYTVHVVELLNYYTNYCTYIKFAH